MYGYNSKIKYSGALLTFPKCKPFLFRICRIYLKHIALMNTIFSDFIVIKNLSKSNYERPFSGLKLSMLSSLCILFAALRYFAVAILYLLMFNLNCSLQRKVVNIFPPFQIENLIIKIFGNSQDKQCFIQIHMFETSIWEHQVCILLSKFMFSYCCPSFKKDRLDCVLCQRSV